ncbi:2-phosphosulfolactate phosphatase [Christensenellaceae bacterium OttesenSCG-928-K19]|nr:2-phosphosulfolactate phosphatase [Christensenellaceae bacterium OttesenSCG-928-K19]
MKVTSYAAYPDVSSGLLVDRTAIMVDALRASATIITAVANKCDRIVPTSEVNEAAAIHKIAEGNMLLCGEVDAQKISGFDLGNSPLEYTQQVVEDKILIYATTNGSVAVKSLVQAEDIFVGTFINATAVAAKAYEIGREIVLVCAGTNGHFSTDDIMAMGCVVERLLKLDETLETDDLCKVALRIYNEAKQDINAALEGCAQFEYLKQLKLYDDLEYCAREDMFDVVPVYREGVIVAG